MMKNLLKKKESAPPPPPPPPPPPVPAPEFTFLRTTTNTQEVIYPPVFPETQEKAPARSRLSSAFHRSPHRPSPSVATPHEASPEHGEENHRRLSQRFHIRRHSRGRRSEDDASPNLPADLPAIPNAGPANTNEAEWEKRATLLAQGGAVRSRSASATRADPAVLLPRINDLDHADIAAEQDTSDASLQRPQSSHTISDAQGDVSIQEAIRLHDSGQPGDLEKSTVMFGTLADPDGANNALAQVLYGLALRHGWGIEASPALALTYLSTAASNSATIEAEALTSGSSTGGAAKGELVLAIYELANSFRHGWGVDKDPVAARQYYETAANLGDVDAMVETATCYTEGIGGGKDKWRAAQYLRRAEKGGRKGVGESWIWKGKYDDPPTSEKEARKRAH